MSKTSLNKLIRQQRCLIIVTRSLAFCIVLTFLTIVGTGSAAAQVQGGPSLGTPPGGSSGDNAPLTAAPQPATQKTYPVWVGYVVIVLMAGAIMGISLMPSKRSHQD